MHWLSNLVWFFLRYNTTPLQSGRYLWIGGSILHQSGKLLHPSLWHGSYLPVSLPPYFYLALPALTQFSEWQHSSLGSLSASINWYRCRPSALHMCSFWGPQPNHFTFGLHLSSVDTLVDTHGLSCNFLFFHPREALLVGCCVTTLPSFSCGIFFSSPP